MLGGVIVPSSSPPSSDASGSVALARRGRVSRSEGVDGAKSSGAVNLLYHPAGSVEFALLDVLLFAWFVDVVVIVPLVVVEEELLGGCGETGDFQRDGS